MEIRQSVEIGAPENIQHNVHIDGDLEWHGADPFLLFQLSEKVGEGSFGSVWKVVPRQNSEYSNRTYTLAIKQLNVDEGQNIEEIEKEITILKKCKSDYIVSYYGAFRMGTKLWILMDYCALGSVADMMDIIDRSLVENEAAWVMKCVLYGLDHLHKMGIIHRDVKGGNILVSGQGDVKIADFGISETLEKTLLKGEVAGTPLWMAPEVCAHAKYDHKADIWSLGITLIEIIDGILPHVDVTPFRAMIAIQQNPPPTVHNPHAFSAEFNEFLDGCLVKDPSMRMEISQLSNLPYVLNARPSLFKNLLMEAKIKGETKKTRKKLQKKIANEVQPAPEKHSLPPPKDTEVEGTVVNYDTVNYATAVNYDTAVNYGTSVINTMQSDSSIAMDSGNKQSDPNRLAWQQSNYEGETSGVPSPVVPVTNNVRSPIKESPANLLERHKKLLPKIKLQLEENQQKLSSVQPEDLTSERTPLKKEGKDDGCSCTII